MRNPEAGRQRDVRDSQLARCQERDRRAGTGLDAAPLATDKPLWIGSELGADVAYYSVDAPGAIQASLCSL